MSLIFFISTILLFIFIGWKSSNSVKDDSSYLLANRKTGLFALVATLVMTEFNTSTLLAFSGFGFSTGIWGLTLPFVFLIGLGFYTITVAKKWKRLNGLSVAEIFSLRYGEDFGKLSSFILILAMIGFSATYVKSLTILFQSFLPNTNSFILSGILMVFVLLIVLRGGLVSIIQTDIISFCIAIVIIPLLFYFSYTQTDKGFLGLIEVFPSQNSENLPIRFVASLIIITMFTYISAPWYGQKIFSATDEKTAFKAVAISSIIVFLLYSFPILAVAFLKVNGVIGVNPDEMIPLILKSYFPESLAGIGFAILFLTGATTLAGVWSASTTMLVGDFLLNKKSKQLGKDFKGSIQITLIFVFLSWLLSNIFVDSILSKLILANIPIMAISFSLLAGFYWKKASRTGAIISTVLGFIWGVGCYIYFGDSGGYTWFWAIGGIPIIFISGIIFSLIYPQSETEKKLYIEFEKRMKVHE